MVKKGVFNWSGGKDSSLALYYILKEKNINVSSLLTTVSSQFERISMHGVRRELLYAQAQSIGIPIKEILLPETPSMSKYDEIMNEAMIELKKQEVTHSIFGDIFLEDLKKYREERLNSVGLKGVFPLWKRNTTELIHEFIDLGFKTVVACANAELGDDFTGRVIDKDFLKDLPPSVDPCGENGEFHTFVFDGPIFKQPIDYVLGEKICKKFPAPKNADDSCTTDNRESSFYYCDLLPGAK